MEESKVTALVTRYREFRGFAELSQAHWVITENVKLQRQGCFYECLTANILAAFKVEAYLNHLGPLIFPDWKDRSPKREKLLRIVTHLGLTSSDDRLVTVEELFKLRDMVAHATSKELRSQAVESGDIEELRRSQPQELWEELSNLEFTRKAYEHTKTLIEEFHRKAGRDPTELSRGVSSYCISAMEDN